MPAYRQSFVGGVTNYTFSQSVIHQNSSVPIDIKYGLSDNLTILGAFNIEDISERFTASIKNQDENSEESFVINQRYQKLKSKFGLQQKIYTDGYNVISSSVSLYPGDFLAAKNISKFESSTTALDLKLMYGRSFKMDLPISHYFKNENQQNLYHFFEAAIGGKRLINNKHNEFVLNFQVGFRPSNLWLFCFGMGNIISKYSEHESSIPNITKMMETSGTFSSAANKRLNKDAKKSFIQSLDEKIECL